MNWSNIDLRNRVSGTVKTTCPNCSHTRKNKHDLCLSVNIDEGVWNCHHCGWKGSRYTPAQKPVNLPELPKTELSDKTLKYFQSRGITAATINRNKITEGKRYMPQLKKEVNCIWFNYFVDGQHTNTKFRDAKKNFCQISGAQKHFYKIDDATKKDVIICEGEFDALTWEEAGFPCVSVPDGALPKGANYSERKFEFLNNDIEKFDKVEKIYLSCDNDEQGQYLQKELARRFGKERCKIIDLKGYKDANDVFQDLGRVDGIEYLKQCVNQAKEYPIDGVITVSQVAEDLTNIQLNGIDKGMDVPMCPPDLLRFGAMDITGWLYFVIGIPNHGKSNWVDCLTVDLSKAGWKFGIYSPEHPTVLHLKRLCEIYLHKSFWSMNPTELMNAMEYLHQRYFFIRPDDEDYSLDNILEKGRQLVKRHGIKGLVIDPWNELEHQSDEQSYISKCLKKINIWKQVNDCAVFLVAHPRKMKKTEGTNQYEKPTGYDAMGSSMFYNKADYGITVYRDDVKDVVEIDIWKVKFRKLIGDTGQIYYHYNKDTSTYERADIVPF